MVDFVDLTNDVELGKRCVIMVDLTADGDEVNVTKRRRRPFTESQHHQQVINLCHVDIDVSPNKVKIQKTLVENLRDLSRDLIMKIFEDYLNITFIKGNINDANRYPSYFDMYS
jgi:hypothetical protein